MIFKISKDIDILKIDLTEHDNQIRAEVIDEVYVMALNNNFDTFIEWLQGQLEEQK